MEPDTVKSKTSRHTTRNETMRLIALLLLSMTLTRRAQELRVYIGEVMKRDGLSYKHLSNGPLTAKVEQYYESDQLDALYTDIDGKWEGLVQFWYENGEHQQEVTHVNGEREGIQHQWNENGEPDEFFLKAGELTGMSYCTEGKQPRRS
jgi:antitoxin component YwqK of YwqJK toxin-antitoxin module